MKTLQFTRLLGFVVVIAIVLLSRASAFANTAINVSGYETALGLPCKINGLDGRCGVNFRGWFGGAGAVANGWVPYTGKGDATVSVTYVGKPDFGISVAITSGTWRLVNKRTVYFGTIQRGSVTWPPANGNIGCGTDVAKVESSLLDQSGNGYSRFQGCLYDFKANGQYVIPPKIWGTFQ